MTAGSIPKLLISFTLPLLVGNAFQQLYNTVDSIVVGNYVGTAALAAVGCTGPIVNTLIGIFSGFSSGAGVVVAQYFGAKDDGRLHSSVQTYMLLTFALCAVITLFGVGFTPAMLRMMDTPEDVMPAATEYLTIFFWGSSGLLIYNAGAGVLRAVGDSTRPLYFLIFSAVGNTVLDIVFVKYCSMGIAGAAYATILTQFLSAIMVMWVLVRAETAYRLDIKHLHIDRKILRKIMYIGWPTSLQMGLTSLSNVFVQGYINRFDSVCMAGWSAYAKLDSFAGLPMNSLGVAVTTFTGQNYGAAKMDRVKKCPKYANILELACFVITSVPIMVFAPQLTALFDPSPDVVEYGAFFLRLITPFYIFVGLHITYICLLRGLGDTRNTMMILLGSFVVFRQIYLYVTYRLGGGIVAVALGYPMGWIVCTSGIFIYYRFVWAKKKGEVLSGEQ